MGYKLSFWRNKQKSEVDLILSNPNNLIGIKIKCNNGKISKAFKSLYPQADTRVINSSNFF